LMLSVGVNVGILASRLVPPKSTPKPSPEVPAPGGGLADGPPQRPIPPRVYRLADELGLVGESREKFAALQQEFFRTTLEARARLRQGQLRLRRELMAAAPDRGAVDAALEQMAAARSDLERGFADSLLASRELLDPEQTRRYLQFIARLRELAGRQALECDVPAGATILVESSLSFLGLGATGASWGGLLDQGTGVLLRTSRVAMVAGAAIAVTLLGFNLAGDALRDRLDPRTRRAA